MAKKFNAFASLIYVTDSEEQGVMRLFDWKERTFEGDRQLYYEASLVKNGHSFLITAAKQSEMGMTAAATLSMKLIERYRPQYLIMPGIAAGIDKNQTDDQLYGDVVVATQVWNYSNGKYTEPENAKIKFGNMGFIPRPTVVEIDHSIIKVIKNAVEEQGFECHLDVGSMASGSAVVANAAALQSIYNQSFNTRGLDMESYAVAYAAREATEPRPHAIIAKSICDFADRRKDDRFQKFATYTSCEFVNYLLISALPDRNLL